MRSEWLALTLPACALLAPMLSASSHAGPQPLRSTLISEDRSIAGDKPAEAAVAPTRAVRHAKRAAKPAAPPVLLDAAPLKKTMRPQNVVASSTRAAAEIRFDDLAITGARDGENGLEVTLQFAGPLNPDAVADLPKMLPEWIEFASPGYDTLLIRTRRKAAFSVAADGAATRLRMAWAVDPAAQTRLNLQRLRLFTKDGDTDRAEALLHELRKTDAEPLALDRAEAELRMAQMDPRAAIDAYEHLIVKNPGDLGLVRARNEVRRTIADRIDALVEWRSVENGDRRVLAETSARADVARATTLSAELRTVGLTAPFVQRSNGDGEPYDQTQAQMRAALDFDEGRGFVWSTTLMVGPAGPGIGGQARWQGSGGDFRIRAVVHEPYWDSVEGIADKGQRDAIEFDYALRFDRHWFARASLGGSQYSLDKVANAANAVTIGAELVREFKLDEVFTLTFNYALDAEYAGDVAQRTTASSVVFTPLPLTDREIHSFGATLLADLADRLFATGALGYSYDRYADGGIYARAGLTYDIDDVWLLAANASYAQVNSDATSGAGGGAVTSVNVQLTYRFTAPGDLFLNGRSQAPSPGGAE